MLGSQASIVWNFGPSWWRFNSQSVSLSPPRPAPTPVTSTHEADQAKTQPKDVQNAKPERPKPTIDGKPILSITFDPDNPSPVDADDDDDLNAEYDAENQSRRCTLCLGKRRETYGDRMWARMYVSRPTILA